MSGHPVVNRRKLAESVHALTRAINPGEELVAETIAALSRVLSDMSGVPCQLALLTPGDVALFGEPTRPAPAVERYTCAGKGGQYERLGLAKPAGVLKAIQGDSGVMVYRDRVSGELYFRDPADFQARMQRIEAEAPSPA